jgi:hypothetical protein
MWKHVGMAALTLVGGAVAAFASNPGSSR